MYATRALKVNEWERTIPNAPTSNFATIQDRQPILLQTINWLIHEHAVREISILFANDQQTFLSASQLQSAALDW